MNTCAVDEQESVVSVEEIEDELSSTDLFLGESNRIGRAGMIRGGIMVPRKDCPKDKVAQYEKLVKQQLSWDEIAFALGSTSDNKSWLAMKNVDYFTVRPGDCNNPEHEALLKEKHGNKREGFDKCLRRIPLSFPFNDISALVDVGLASYGKSGWKHKGRYIKHQLTCETPVDMGKNVVHFGPTPVNRRPCKPNECPEYKSKACKLTGLFTFRIPEMPGMGVWVYRTSSFYTMQEIRNKLRVLENLFTKRYGIPLSAIPGGFFYLKKVKAMVGRPLKEQWLATVETDHSLEDIVKMIEQDGAGRTVKHLEAAKSAARMLNGAGRESREPVPAIPDKTGGEATGASAGDKPPAQQKSAVTSSTPPPEGQKSATAASAVTGQPKQATPPKPGNTAAGVSGWEGDWPQDAPAPDSSGTVKQPVANPTPSQQKLGVPVSATGGQGGPENFSDLPDKVLAAFLEAISKNAFFAGVSSFRYMIEAFCRVRQGVSLKDLDKEAVRKFMAAIQKELKSGAKEMLAGASGKAAVHAPDESGIAPGVVQ